ncbi:MAG: chromate transporter [Pelosinus sp.]|nr:chromate transporter [Pelosinus sp.]
MYWLLFFAVVLKAVLFSTGGMGPLPSLHNDLIAYGWSTEKEFTEALAIGQLTPGPSGLWVLSLCYLVAGLPGALLSCLALLLPPQLILLVQYGYSRIAGHEATQGVLDGVVLVIVSFSVLVLAEIMKSNGLDISLLIITAVSAALAISRRVSANYILAVAALVGFIAN